MSITHSRGGTIFTGDAIAYYRLCVLKAAVSLEMKGLHRRGPVVWRQVKREFNLNGNKAAVYAWLCATVDELAAKQEHITEA